MNPYWKKGVSGNPAGKPKGCQNADTKELKEALAEARKRHDKSFIESFVERAYTSESMAIALAKKILPDLAKHGLDEETQKIVAEIIVNGIKRSREDGRNPGN